MIDLEVEDPAWTKALPDAGALALATAEATLASEGAVGEGVSLLLTDDAALCDLNRRFRQQDKPTNVLAFPAPQNLERFLGDVALAYGVCAREASEQGKPLAHHLQHLVAHGVLHLLGYEHETDAQATEMEDLERAVLAGLGIPDPYLAGP
ncbi:rRNA maturation RNase YbeY [Phenylobacterium sp.]|uniref:rRNA maturation RNase YbeY n=1 Tax=Phenylobacterium sp. TaxID=1871053 RepID=UPI00374D1BB9